MFFPDQRCHWEHVQLGFLHAAHCRRVLLHAQPCPWRSQRVFQDGDCNGIVYTTTTVMITMQ